MRTELISIIIPTYNRGHVILETLESIRKQSYTMWECIIVDDGSTDNTEFVVSEFIKNDSRFQFYRRPKSLIKGPNACRNFGFYKSKGVWVKWLDSDDLLLDNCLKYKAQFIVDHLDAIVCKIELVHFETNRIIKVNNIYSKQLVGDYITNNISFYVCGPLWKRSFLEKQIELFDINIYNLDDWDFNLRMLYQKPKIHFLDEKLIKYRRHENSLSNEIGKLNLKEIKSEFVARKKHIDILTSIDKEHAELLNIYIINRYNQLLRLALIKQNNISKFLLKSLIANLYFNQNYFGILKSIVGYTSYKIFNRGYFFFDTK